MNVIKEIVQDVDNEKHIEDYDVLIYVICYVFEKVKEIDDDSL